jgi:hypothetical protein
MHIVLRFVYPLENVNEPEELRATEKAGNKCRFVEARSPSRSLSRTIATRAIKIVSTSQFRRQCSGAKRVHVHARVDL